MSELARIEAPELDRRIIKRLYGTSDPNLSIGIALIQNSNKPEFVLSVVLQQ
jgi:hypothetical protein